MKFAEHLSAHITPEWRKQYISYEEMKTMLYVAVEEAPSAELVEPEIVRRHFAHFDEQFFHYCDKELAKINTFYSEKMAEATRKFAALQNELRFSLGYKTSSRSPLRQKTVEAPSIPARKIQELKLAFSEFYLSLILLQNYQNLNFTGFRKILKKHDKLLSVDSGVRYRQEYVETSHINTNKDIDRLISETETTVTTELEAGDRQKAMKRLRVPPLGEQQSPWTTFKVGLFSGSFIVLFLAVVLSETSECMEKDWVIRPIVNCLPAWFRFAQCLRRYRDTKEAFPHLVNAGKYSSTFLVVLFATLRSVYSDDYEDTLDNPYLYLWVFASIVSSCYAYTWDIKMDWGLFDKSAGENKFLREETVYSSTSFYYFAVVEDFILRFAWAYSYVLIEANYISGDLMTSINSPLEVFRRFVWNFFRLENEHLNNCGKFRAVRDISVAPIDSSDQSQIIRMMDEDDGVIHRRKRKPSRKVKDDKQKLLSAESVEEIDNSAYIGDRL